MTKKFYTKSRKTLLVTLLLVSFIMGYMSGWLTSEQTISDLELEIESLNLDIRSVNQRVQFSKYFGDICEPEHIDFIGRRIYETGIELDRLERRGLEDTNDYIILKQRHNVNQVLFYTELKKFKEECEYDKNIILFFFDGSEGEEARAQGEEISIAIEERDVIVLPMDYGYTNYISYFYDYHSINELPALVINYDTTLEGFSEADVIETYLK